MTSFDSTTEIVSDAEPRSEIRLFDVAAVFFFALVTGSIGIVVGGAIGGVGSLAETCGSLIGLWAGIVPGTLLVLRVRATGDPVRDLGLRVRIPADLGGVAAGLASQFVLLPLIYVVVQLFVSRDLTSDLEAPAKDLTDQAHGGAAFALLAVLLIVGAPIVEELFYRGMLLRALKRHLPPVASIVVSGIVFGAAHFDLVTLPGLAAFGIVLAWLAHRSGRLGPGILAHAAFNAATVAYLWQHG
ncbi:MAG: protease family protein [Actinomycetota bacterium]|jgi:membrane protease YdiL (CAAX protease family)